MCFSFKPTYIQKYTIRDSFGSKLGGVEHRSCKSTSRTETPITLLIFSSSLVHAHSLSLSLSRSPSCSRSRCFPRSCSRSVILFYVGPVQARFVERNTVQCLQLQQPQYRLRLQQGLLKLQQDQIYRGRPFEMRVDRKEAVWCGGQHVKSYFRRCHC